MPGTTRVKVVADKGSQNWTAYLTLDDSGTCIEADARLSACLGHAKGALRSYFTQQQWTATILVPKSSPPTDDLPRIQPAPAAPPGVPLAVMADPMVQAILAAFPGAIVRPIRQVQHE